MDGRRQHVVIPFHGSSPVIHATTHSTSLIAIGPKLFFLTYEIQKKKKREKTKTTINRKEETIVREFIGKRRQCRHFAGNGWKDINYFISPECATLSIFLYWANNSTVTSRKQTRALILFLFAARNLRAYVVNIWILPWMAIWIPLLSSVNQTQFCNAKAVAHISSKLS